MDSYKCIVRLGGEIGQEVPKHGISAAHIVMLQIEHGDDAVHAIEKIDNVLRWPDSQNKNTPKAVTPGMMRGFLEHEFGEEKVSKVFGSFYGSALPEILPGFERTRAIPGKKPVQNSKASATMKPVEENPDEDDEFESDEDIDTDVESVL